jgi:hypothetical protein
MVAIIQYIDPDSSPQSIIIFPKNYDEVETATEELIENGCEIEHVILR